MGRATLHQLCRYIRALRLYQAEVERMHDAESLKTVSDTQMRLEEMLIVLGCDKTGKTVKGRARMILLIDYKHTESLDDD